MEDMNRYNPGFLKVILAVCNSRSRAVHLQNFITAHLTINSLTTNDCGITPRI